MELCVVKNNTSGDKPEASDFNTCRSTATVCTEVLVVVLVVVVLVVVLLLQFNLTLIYICISQGIYRYFQALMFPVDFEGLLNRLL